MKWQRYWDIIVYRTYAELKSEAQLNYMGYVWWVLEPLLNTIMFYAILTLVLEQSSVGAISFLLVGSITWQWFASGIMSSSSSIFDAGSMLKFIYLPKIVLPLISILANTWKFLFLLLLLLIWSWCTGHLPSQAYLALPLILLLQLTVILGVSLPLAALMPYFPDAKVAMDAILRSLMLVSGIFFAVEQVPAEFHVYFYMNPMAVLIEAYRAVLLQGLWPDWGKLAYVACFGSFSIMASLLIYKRIDLSIVKAIHR